MKPAPIPNVMHCPFCGDMCVERVKGTPRCYACCAVFFVMFSRYMRPRKKQLKENER